MGVNLNYLIMATLCRFAPSPTGFLHVGNIRAAIINHLYAKKTGGKFMLRLDDTDISRVKDEYRDMILTDMSWLGLEIDEVIKQSDRLDEYEKAKQALIDSGRLYECYETQSELELQRKQQAMSGLPPIYDRASYHLTDEQKQKFRDEGRRPHYRFFLEDKTVSWDDKIKGKIESGVHFSDPVLVRDNGAPTYTFCSVVDDLAFNVTDIIRGEDHITNTVVQTQIFEALIAVGFGERVPNFAHLALIQARDDKISKRKGGFDVKSLRESGIEPMSLLLLLSQVGTSKSVEIYKDISALIENFDFSNFSKSATKYDINEVKLINQKLLQILDFDYVKNRLQEINCVEIGEEFWNIFKENIDLLHEINEWYEICKSHMNFEISDEDKEFLAQIVEFLPQDCSKEDAWQEWLAKIKENTERKGKNLFMPIRVALTGKSHGPEMKYLINFIARDEILSRLKG